MRRRYRVFATCALLGPGSAAIAQAARPSDVPVTHLRPPDGALRGAFHPAGLNTRLYNVRQIRELADGRVLVKDAGGSRFMIADFSKGTVDTIPDLSGAPLVRLPGDSSLIVSYRIGWIFYEGTRRLGMLPPENPVVQAAQTIMGADRSGSVLVLLRGTDSNVAVRISRATGVQDTVTRLWAGMPVRPGTLRPICQVYELAVMTLDGWIAVLRANPYRVDWRGPDGAWVRGRPIAVPSVSMDDRQKQAYLAWEGRERRPPVAGPRDWPATVCPVTGQYWPLMSPDGKLLVYRVPTAEAPGTTYDVIDRRGVLERQIALPANEAIQGFGERSVYVVVADDSSDHLRRHPWP